MGRVSSGHEYNLLQRLGAMYFLGKKRKQSDCVLALPSSHEHRYSNWNFKERWEESECNSDIVELKPGQQHLPPNGL